MKRRQVTQPASLTSLIDVLFILVFASLVQTAVARDRADAAEAAREAEAEAVAVELDAGVAPDAAPSPPRDHAVLRDRALADLAATMAGRPAVVARISVDGMLTAFELTDRRVELGVPLLERVPDVDVVVAYLGDRTAELQICTMAALRLGVDDLSQHLVIIAPDVPISELSVALVNGLRRDADRCFAEQRTAAVVVDPAAIEPGRTTPPAPPTEPSPTEIPTPTPGEAP